MNTKAFRGAIAVRLIDGEDVLFIVETVLTPALDRLDEALARVGA